MQKIVIGLITLAGIGLIFALFWLGPVENPPQKPEPVSIQEFVGSGPVESEQIGDDPVTITAPEPPTSPDEREEENVVAGFDMTRFHKIQTETEGGEKQ